MLWAKIAPYLRNPYLGMEEIAQKQALRSPYLGQVLKRRKKFVFAPNLSILANGITFLGQKGKSVSINLCETGKLVQFINTFLT